MTNRERHIEETENILKFICVCLSLALVLSGCSVNTYQKATLAYEIIDAVLNIGAATVPTLASSGKISAQESQVLSAQFVTLGNLNDGYKACIDNVVQTKLPNATKYLVCANGFISGLNNPQGATALRYFSPQAIDEYNLVVTAVSKGLSALVLSLGGMAPPPPTVVQGGTGVKAADLRELAKQVGYAGSF